MNKEIIKSLTTAMFIAGVLLTGAFIINIREKEQAQKRYQDDIKKEVAQQAQELEDIKKQDHDEDVEFSTYGQESSQKKIQNQIKQNMEEEEANEALKKLDEIKFNRNSNYNDEGTFHYGNPQLPEFHSIDMSLPKPIEVPELKGIEIPQSKNLTGAECDSSVGKYLPQCNHQ